MPREAVEENPALVEALRGLNAGAVRADIEAWRAAGKLRAESGALEALALTLAMTLDLGAMVQTATVSKELRATLADLRVDDDGDDDQEFLNGLGTAVPAKVGDAAQPAKGKPRAARRRGDDAARPAADAVAAARPRRRARSSG